MKKRFFSLLICIAGFASCKKQDASTPLPTGDPCDRPVEILRYQQDSLTTVHNVTITYDDKGRVHTANGPWDFRTTFTYQKNRIVATAADGVGNDVSQTYLLDNEGRITGTIDFEHQYEYNQQGYLQTIRTVLPASSALDTLIISISYQNGDPVRITSNNENLFDEMVYTYTDKPYQDLMGYNHPLVNAALMSRPAFFLSKAGYFGKLPTHLIQSMRKDPYLAIDFLYAKDNKGRVISIVGQWAFNYQCP
jgi:YD repeat-containing protein